jgi:hypothetical protein
MPTTSIPSGKSLIPSSTYSPKSSTPSQTPISSTPTTSAPTGNGDL